jgi:hypothetical protein
MNDWSRRWDDYTRWADDHAAPDQRSPVQIVSDLDLLYSGYSEEMRRTDPDPAKTGVQELYRILGLYDRKLQSRIGARPGD